MSASFIGEIKMLPYAFSPMDWAYCNGELQSIGQNPALFAIIGTIYGGDGRTTMRLPDLQGRSPLHVGGAQDSGPGLSPYRLGEHYGTPTVTLTTSTMPSHDHGKVQAAFGTFVNSTDVADETTYLGPQINPKASAFKTPPMETPVQMAEEVVGVAGGSEAHNNLQPYLVVPFCICLSGIFPTRN